MVDADFRAANLNSTWGIPNPSLLSIRKLIRVLGPQHIWLQIFPLCIFLDI